jgi:AcrR family transcriptional regulator
MSDPARSMALLWRTKEPMNREGRTDLSVDRIANAAIAIADADGMGALTMRRVGEVLAVGTMSPYTYVPGKAELVNLMIDTVYAETPRPDDQHADWRSRLERIAHDNWVVYRRHPWLAVVETSRPVLGPNLLAKYNYELNALSGTGLPALEMDSVLTLVLGHVRNTARAAAEVAQIERETGMTDAQWWAAYSPWLAKYSQAGSYQVAAEAGTAAGEQHNAAYDPEYAYQFGLSRLLDGIAVLVAKYREPNQGGLNA